MTATPEVAQRRSAAEWEDLGVACPRCHGSLRDESTQALACTRCDARYPSCAGIPDLRTGDDPYLTRAEDGEAAERLLVRAGALGFAALFASYYEGNGKVTAEQAAQFTRGVLAAGERAAESIAVWETVSGVVPAPGGVTLDIGCGTAPLAIAWTRRGQRVVALDVGMRWLVLARRRAAEAGIDLPVVCANAEALPFRAGSVARVAGESVLENLAAPERALGECHRALASGGSLWLTTANRLSLAPDPHLGVLAGGWWPEKRLRAHAERTGKVFPVRHLFTPGELAAQLRRHGFGAVRLALPRFAPAQVASLSPAARGIVAAYHLARRLPVVRAVVLRAGPTLVCTATRK